MRKLRRECLLLGLAVLAAISLAGGDPKKSQAPGTIQALPANSTVGLSGPKKTVKPLLLLDDTPAEKKGAGEVADNSRCHVCHVNFETEKLTSVHALANVGCAKCHGDSDNHIADESWASGGNGTAPDTMFPRDRINLACLGCHKVEKVFKVEPHKVDDLWLVAYGMKVCTECHGDLHRMAIRKCKWK